MNKYKCPKCDTVNDPLVNKTHMKCITCGLYVAVSFCPRVINEEGKMMANYHFPKFTYKHYSADDQIKRVEMEIEEFHEAVSKHDKDLEIMDILHAAETLVRQYFNSDEEFERVKADVTVKNRERGYYD